MASPGSPVRAPDHIKSLLSRLHEESEKQEASITPDQYAPVINLYKQDPVAGSKALDELMRDKFIALEKDKADFVYQMIVSSGAKYVVEAGTSFGVSTIYLALGVAEVEKMTGGMGKVIGTEKERTKAEKARGYWRECGEEVESRIELREGDLVSTLASNLETVDLLLLDIWPPVALPALKAVLPKLRPGALVLTDNTIQAEHRYQELLSVLRDPKGDFRSSTLPFKGGFEVSVYVPRSR
ncbi:S-adenosyl-L-methionine-dependent methyltransferase [Zopfia rhizophila CBS 207.26]|uniref:S-adenosyl-L-methionine-dependent methyltransferase n=1 Tax=Zopfia rhizophila CBS 207.26 TaxID=1314779 RepID=A0A6A6E1N9_9PEZI|nr:S-adenosyl-L-methionine-dependent methyltransferase [Zopfia rhizophila CBS 207.26]